MITKIRFDLKNAKGTGKQLIYLIFSYGHFIFLKNGKKKYKPIKYSTSLTIEPEYWDFSNMQPNKKYIAKYGRDLTSRLNLFEVYVDNIYKDFVMRSIYPYPEMIRQKLDTKLGKINQVKLNNGLVQFMEDELEKEKTSKFNSLSESTIEKSQIFIRKLEKYENSIKKHLTFENITKVDYVEFFDFCDKEHIKKEGKGLAQSTLQGLQKKYNKYLEIGIDNGFKLQFNHRDKKIKINENIVDHVYLGNEELDKLINVNLRGLNRSYRESLDAFIVQSYTGLRYGDLKVLSNFTIKTEEGVNYVDLTTSKIGVKTVIPVLKPVQDIYNKNGNKFLKPPAGQTINKNIKELCLMVGIRDITSLNIQRSTSRGGELKEKWEFIVNHTGRRSFITNSLLMGVPDYCVKKITHKPNSRDVFQRYDKATMIKNAALYISYLKGNENYKWLVS